MNSHLRPACQNSVPSSITMPPRLLRVQPDALTIARLTCNRKLIEICPFCSHFRALRPGPSRTSSVRSLQYWSRSRQQFNVASASDSDKGSSNYASNPRSKLRDALADLQKHAGSYVNLSRLQLALRGLDQPPGQETIRIAVLGWGKARGETLQRVKHLLRLLLADPLNAESEWERVLSIGDSDSKPLLLKVGYNGAGGLLQSNSLVQELAVSSPMLHGHKLEILALEMTPPSMLGDQDEEWMDLLLVPTMEIPNSSSGRYTSVTTPVHKCLVVADGIAGAAVLQHYPFQQELGLIEAAVNIPSLRPDEILSSVFRVIAIDKATAALKAFRQSVDNAISYEQDWYASGMPKLLDFLKDDTAPGGAMKRPLRGLIETLLEKTLFRISTEEVRRKRAAISAKMSDSKAEALRQGLLQWAERAHTELRDSLDTAFSGRRWQKLGWWKLFWRVDDVSLIATDILNQRFLTDAEREVIYLAGVIDEALSKDIPKTFDKNWAYKAVIEQEASGILTHAPPPTIQDLIETKDDAPPRIKRQPWPLEIPMTRALLAADTIPALQALAQKLLLQTITTSSFSTAFAGLIYVSTLSTSLYEAGAIAALGIVWSLRRMQGKWETARKFWEGEVREEGRKAVRGVEIVVMNALVQPDRPLEGAGARSEAREAVAKAEAALWACK